MKKSDLTAEIWWLWLLYAPSLRFMQFMSNFIHWEESYNGVDVFYLPDDVLIKHLQDFCKTLQIKEKRKNEKGKKEKDKY